MVMKSMSGVMLFLRYDEDAFEEYQIPNGDST